MLKMLADMRARAEDHDRALTSRLPEMLFEIAPLTYAPNLNTSPSSTSRLLGLNVSLSSGESSPATNAPPPARSAAKLMIDDHLRRVDELALQLRREPYPHMVPTAISATQRAATASPPSATSDAEPTFDTTCFSPSPPKATISYLTNAAPAQPASSPPHLRAAAAGRLLFPNATTPNKP